MSGLHTLSEEARTAVIIERLDRMASDHAEHRESMNAALRAHRESTDEKFDLVNRNITELGQRLAENSATLKTAKDRAKGGYVAFVLLSGALTYFTDTWGKVLTMFGK